jgi:hypothetical protein
MPETPPPDHDARLDTLERLVDDLDQRVERLEHTLTLILARLDPDRRA